MHRTVAIAALLISAPAVPAAAARASLLEPATGSFDAGAGPYRTVCSRVDD
ncbi:MAG: hypothetical protein HKO62_07375 [Gammaproteobacteria bacterium]|nr:hypothetical protein [Gammaproteobacteria bacterium]